MGFWHEWEFSKKYDDAQWSEIKEDALILFDALPAVAKKRAMRMMREGFGGIVSGAIALLSERKQPARGKFGGQGLDPGHASVGLRSGRGR